MPVLIRVADNGPFLPDLERLLSGLLAMGGDPGHGPLERDLGRLPFTFGDSYTNGEWEALTAIRKV